MSEEIPTKSKPPAAAMKDQLDAIATDVQGLVQRQRQTGEIATLLADARDTIQEAVGVLHDQGLEMLQELRRLQQQPSVPPRTQLEPWILLTILALTIAGSMAFGYWQAPKPKYDGLASQIDTVLTQTYPWLPKAVQDELSAVYQRQGIAGPGQRQKGKP